MNPQPTISVLAPVLLWDEAPDAAVARLEARYAEVLGMRLAEVLAGICRSDAALGAQLLRQAEAAGEAGLVAALLAPETSRRLVTRLHGEAEVREHLRSLFAPHAPAQDGPAWPALGGRVPVLLQPPEDPRLPPAARHAQQALALVSQGCPPAAAFVLRVMRRLLVCSDDKRDGFFSNSPQGLVGQAVLTNAHLPLVDDVVLAEALVHEAIHGFVGMSEAIGLAGGVPGERWLRDERFYEGFSCTVSPWTGKALDLPTYLHACFVWWGLLHLWAALAGSGLFEERRLRSRLARAARGFAGAALLQPLLPHRAAIHPELLAGFEAMARAIGPMLAESGLDQLLLRMDAVASAP